MTSSPVPRHPFLAHPGPIPFAHRGGALEAPENTMEAFEYAVSLGFRYLETDVHLTADGVVVAFHDDDMERLTGRKGHVGDFTWEDLSKIRVGGGRIPTIEDILRAWPEVRVNVDCKSDEVAEPFLEIVDACDAWDRVLVGSFSHRRIQRVRRTCGSRVATALSPREVAGLRAASLGAPWSPPPNAVSAQVPPRQGPLRLVDSRFVRTAHELGLHVHVWTIDSREEMEALLDLGVDGIMTDRPSLLKDVLSERGQWY